MRVAFIGPVGSGKSSQAQRLSWSLPFYNRSPRLSTGDLVRAQIEARTPLGARIGALHDAGEPVPDGVVFDLLLPHVRTAGGFVLDDFPANAGQAEILDAELEERGAGPLRHVISLEGPSDDELVGRVLGGRVHSRATDAAYHLKNDPPPGPEKRLDPGPFERRSDDTEESLRRRLGAYRREHALLKEHYEARGVLTVIDAGRPLDKVAEGVLDALGHPENPQYYAV
ncbi:AAA family ATPase [Rubrobacter tropicus]|uniref:Adenylate kinase n=1 Tax=Rubrobacter tropicus TaxID=2653851 RepID=A0A6G8Q687_9ACTN|nr:nucleoside monophosphate kinase [Rubrobacter tropicus]QIN81995.1 AAA family ATPase [Rubrobacter tropicus]